MSKLARIRHMSLLLLITGILVLSVGFIFISCGKDPQLKVAESDNGPFAIDLSLAPGPLGVFFAVNEDFPRIAGKELTVEAWVKSRTPSLSGGIVGRNDGLGIVLFVNKNEPKLGVRRTPVAPEAAGCSQISVTSTECIVDSNALLVQDVWTHIAGVLTSEDQSSGPANCSAVGTENPHIAIYINGELQNCSTTGSLFAEDPASDILAVGAIGDAGPDIDNGGVSGRFDGVIDEVRLWTVARSKAQIQACMGQELSFTVMGDCYMDSSILKGYWRFNEGEGSGSTDFSGAWGTGGFESPALIPWSGAWVQGVPIVRDPG
ncbi:MAG: LamG domain-containing protein [Nitrospirae bacterium]|nr:LamG domain-containing protein [Nitrospirota bacterium]